MVTFLGHFFIALVVGFFFFCTFIAFAACAVGRSRELGLALSREEGSKND